jgi:hypothetical protein
MTSRGKLACSYPICDVRNNRKCAPGARHQPLVKHHRSATAQPDRPAARAAALPTPSARCPCGSIRARRRARAVVGNQRYGLQEWGLGHSCTLGKPYRSAARQAEGNHREETVGGCGTPASEASRCCPRPLRGGQRNRPRAGTGAPRATAYRQLDTKPHRNPHVVRSLAMPISTIPKSVSDSCPRFMSDKRGLGLFQAQQRHAKTWRVVPETARAHNPQGSRRAATRGWS